MRTSYHNRAHIKISKKRAEIDEIKISAYAYTYSSESFNAKLFANVGIISRTSCKKTPFATYTFLCEHMHLPPALFTRNARFEMRVIWVVWKVQLQNALK